MRYVVVKSGIYQTIEILRVNDNRPGADPNVKYFALTSDGLTMTNATTFAAAAKSFCKRHDFTLVGKVTHEQSKRSP